MTTGSVANMPGIVSDHRMVGQSFQLQDVCCNADELKRRRRAKILRWRVPDDKMTDYESRLHEMDSFKVAWELKDITKVVQHASALGKDSPPQQIMQRKSAPERYLRRQIRTCHGNGMGAKLRVELSAKRDHPQGEGQERARVRPR